MVRAPFLLAGAVAASLVSALAGGLLRADAFSFPAGEWLAGSAAWHAALMICGFMGSVIGAERAVAARSAWAWSAPVASACGALALLLGAAQAGMALFLAASLVFVAVNLRLFARQRAAHTRLLVGGALGWTAGNASLLGGDMNAAVIWWFAFLVWTIAAERLEMTRLLPRHPWSGAALHAILFAMAGAAGLSHVAPTAGAFAWGASLAALAAWMMAFDIARRTVRTAGPPRYMAVALLGGYGWLALAGIAWMADAAGWTARDTALHALGVGFVFSMMLAHAPVILPAVAGIRLHFTAWLFYPPLAFLHLSMLVRVAALADAQWRLPGAALNAAALVTFALAVCVAAVLARLLKASSQQQSPRSHHVRSQRTILKP